MGYFRNPDAMWREEDPFKDIAIKGLNEGKDVSEVGTSVILMPNGMMYSLNLLGTEIWKLCDGRSMEEIVSALVERFDVGADELREDVLAFIEDMKGAGLIHEQ